tara:strand:- start:10982 stop:14572 length:3591 start_codon:yes stop_codon:yes gene_type:complete
MLIPQNILIKIAFYLISFSSFFSIIFSSGSILFGKERLILESANILERKIINNKPTKIISGNVVFTKGPLTIKCDQGMHYEEEALAILYGNVLASKEDLMIKCDTIKYFSEQDKVFSIGDSHVWNKSYDLKADSIIVYTKIDSGIANGNTRLIQNNQTITANRIEYQKMENDDAVSYTSIGNVTIKDSMRTATCGEARYNRKKETTELLVNPRIIDESNRILSGNKISLFYDNEQLNKLYIPESASAISSAYGYKKKVNDSLNYNDTIKFMDSMKGSELLGFFNHGKIDSLRIHGMAQTLYHIFEDSVYQGNNDASGDTIIMNFNDNELEKLTILNGAKGTYTPDSIATDMKSRIDYSADFIKYLLKDQKSNFNGNAIIEQDGTNLSSGFIKIDWQNSMLHALPTYQNDTLQKLNLPIIKEKGRDPMIGSEMTYNLKTKKGKIRKGKTKADDGHYTGDQIRNQFENVFFIENSTYSTCDLDTAHFHFESKKMKIIQNDLVIAKPIILYIGQIPIIGIPLGIFPHKGGQRHSGWIMPSYGDNKNRGQYIQGLGFYWAPSDYWDTKLTMGFGDKQGLTFRSNTFYRVRYRFSGSLNFFGRQFLSSGQKDITKLGEQHSKSTTIKWTHKQEMRNNQSFNANATYSTNGDYNKKYGLSISDRMDQKAISNLSYSKRWPKSKNSFSASFYSNNDLLIYEKTNPESRFYVNPTRSGTQINLGNKRFPKISFRRGQSNLFPTLSEHKKWYNTIAWNYTLNYTNTERSYYNSVETDNSFSWERHDSDSTLKKYNEQNNGWIHTSSINAPQKIFKYISINPSLNLKSAWVNKTQEGIWNGTSFDKEVKPGFATRTTGSFSMNANTQIYGLIGIPIGPLKAVRHIISPTVGYSWTPDFSKPFFGKDLGYVETKIDPNTSKNIYHDRFAGTMAGSTPKTETKSMTFSVNNVLQAKIKKGEDEKKIDLLSWRMNSSYNFAADSMQLANLRSNIRSKLARKLNLDLSMTHDFYSYNEETRKRTGKLIKKQMFKNSGSIIYPRLTNMRLSTGFRIKSKNWINPSSEKSFEEDTTFVEDDLAGPGLNKTEEKIKGNLKNKNLWNSNISLSFSYSALNPSNISKTFWANTNSSFNLTNKWKVSYRARFNLLERDLVSHSVSIYRDLHCWELSLNWTPNGIGQGINFKLNVKSPTLQDLKIEKRGGVYSGAGF